MILRAYWLLLSLLSAVLLALPAEAARLLFWRFDTTRNQFVFTTDAGVQPQAQLLSNPTRLVIDLPGTSLGRPTVNQAVGGLIRSVRIGQFDGQTTRIVIEVASGYTLDPQKVQFRGASPTQWSVQLPPPERISASSVPPTSPPPSPSTPSRPPSPTPSGERIELQTTSSGFFLSLAGQQPQNTRVRRDRGQIAIDLDGIVFPSSLLGQVQSVGRFGVETVQFSQVQSSPAIARVTLNVTEESPSWQVSTSSLGGIMLVPTAGQTIVRETTPVPSTSPPASQLATIDALELRGDRLLAIRSDRTLSATQRWNGRAGVYEITLPSARLADQLAGPQLTANGPISELRVRQQDSQTVVILLRPALGYRLGAIAPLNNRGVGIELRRGLTPPTSQSSNPRPERQRIPIPPPSRNPRPPRRTPVPPPRTSPRPPTTNLPRVPSGRILVTIDPGHGGKDPGAIGIGGLREKDVVLDISLQVARLLEQQGVRVLMTRSNDRFISLQGRTQMANRARANLFVSIHANAISLRRPEVNGLETYYYSSGQRLASAIHQSILQSVNIGDRRIRRARFYVLRNSSMPAVLVETGFVTGNRDAANLRNSNHRRQMAAAIAHGILLYLRRGI